MRQISIADLLDEQELPIELGEYVEHQSRPGFVLELISEQYITPTGKTGVIVKDQRGKTYPVLLDLLKRYKKG